MSRSVIRAELGGRGEEQHQHIAQMGQRRIEPQVSRSSGGEQRVAGRDDGGDDDDQRSVDDAVQDQGFRNDDAGEQGRYRPCGPRRIMTASATPRPGSHAVIGRPLSFVDEACPFERKIDEDEQHRPGEASESAA